MAANVPGVCDVFTIAIAEANVPEAEERNDEAHDALLYENG